MLRYHIIVINDPLFFVLISRTVSWLGVRVGQIRQNVSLPFPAPLIPSTIRAHLCLFVPGGRQWKKPGNIFHEYCVYFLIIFPYTYHFGWFSPNASARRIHKRAQKSRRSRGIGGRVCQKSLAEFAARRRQIKCNPFFAAACTSQKTLLGLQVWNLFAFSEQIMRAADCKPFVKKGPRPFLTN